jgi:Fe-Mn family superoxide dismutase
MIQKKNFESLVGKLPGFSPKQIEQHLGLYEGYVKKINQIRDEIEKIPYAERKGESNFSYGRYTELKRREAVPYNGVFLHEMYFENLGGRQREPKAEVETAISEAFGSVSNWEKDLAACAEGATNGWVLLTYDRLDGRLHHNQIWEHTMGLMVHQEHLLALDVWEHAFMIDFGTDKKSYLEAFLKNVKWETVAERFAAAQARATAEA